jgi:hypothetical protein
MHTLGLLPVLTEILEIAWIIYTLQLRNFALYMLAVTIEYAQWSKPYLLKCVAVVANSAKLKKLIHVYLIQDKIRMCFIMIMLPSNILCFRGRLCEIGLRILSLLLRLALLSQKSQEEWEVSIRTAQVTPNNALI